MKTVARILLVSLGLVLILALVLPLLLAPTSRHMYGYGYGGMMGPGMMGGFGLFGMVITISFVALLVAGVVWLVQGAAKGQGAMFTPSLDTPLDILRRRYASGEITKKQFEEMKRDLGS